MKNVKTGGNLEQFQSQFQFYNPLKNPYWRDGGPTGLHYQVLQCKAILACLKMKPKKDTMEVKTLKARKSDRSVKKRGKKYQDKFHVHQSQAQIEI